MDSCDEPTSSNLSQGSLVLRIFSGLTDREIVCSGVKPFAPSTRSHQSIQPSTLAISGLLKGQSTVQKLNRLPSALYWPVNEHPFSFNDWPSPIGHSNSRYVKIYPSTFLTPAAPVMLYLVIETFLGLIQGSILVLFMFFFYFIFFFSNQSTVSGFSPNPPTQTFSTLHKSMNYVALR